MKGVLRNPQPSLFICGADQVLIPHLNANSKLISSGSVDVHALRRSVTDTHLICYFCCTTIILRLNPLEKRSDAIHCKFNLANFDEINFNQANLYKSTMIGLKICKNLIFRFFILVFMSLGKKNIYGQVIRSCSVFVQRLYHFFKEKSYVLIIY